MASHAAALVDWMELVEPVFSHAAPGELPSPSVMTMAQDGQGFLWVGTQGGLARYDGYRFKSFSPRPGDPTGLPDGNISKLMVDSRGQLWLGMQTSGLVRYQASTETFRTWGADDTGRHGPYSAAINALLEADNGQLWLGGNAGLERFNPLNGRSTAFPLEAGEARGYAMGRYFSRLVPSAQRCYRIRACQPGCGGSRPQRRPCTEPL